MVKYTLKRVFSIMNDKPFKLWGICLLCVFLNCLAFSLFSGFIGVAIAINVLLNASMAVIFLRAVRGKDFKALDLFSCFKSWKRIKHILFGMAWRYLLLLLWSLIPIVGIIFAIIKTYEYRFTVYVLLSDPEISITDAMAKSKEMTNGHKGEMFLSDIIPVLFFLVALFVVFLFGLLLGLINAYISLFIIYSLYLALAVCFVAFVPLYSGLTFACYYDKLHRLAKTQVKKETAENTENIEKTENTENQENSESENGETEESDDEPDSD